MAIMSNLTTLVSFDPNISGLPVGSLIVDAAGDLFGTTQLGGSDNLGTVFELVNSGGGYTPTTLVSFNGADGADPFGAVLADASGDLFGTTAGGGASGDGAVFELVKTAGGYTPTTLLSFSGADGAVPNGALITDAAGDLFGTTFQGGSSGDGTVFELVRTAGGYSATTLLTFNGANGANANGALLPDAAGDLFGTTAGGGGPGWARCLNSLKPLADTRQPRC
jgi:uncharacterized repeat protein (TIGR03803 family)